MKKLFRISTLLLGLLIIIPAINIAQASSTFPAEEVGMAAYVKLDSIDITTFENATGLFFDSAELSEPDADYMIGIKNYYAYNTNFNALVPIHFYLRTDGWLVAYLLNTQEASMMVNWNSTIGLQDNLLKAAIEDAIGKLQSSYSGSIQYYNFMYPDANKMTLVRENVNNPGQSNSFTAIVPGTIYNASYAMASFGGGSNNYTDYANLYFVENGSWINVARIKDDPFIYGSYDSSYFTPEVSHEIILSKNFDDHPASAATLILYGI